MSQLLAIPDHVPLSPTVDVNTILEIHRGDGFVGFVRKNPEADGNQFQNLFSIPTAELRDTFLTIPGYADWLMKDSYFTLNSYYRAAPYNNRLTGLPDVWRKEQYLQHLLTCYADLDVGRPESEDPAAQVSWREAAMTAGVMMDSGVIPPASIIARSGRGVYLLWLLHDPGDETKLQRAWPEKIALYKEVNRQIATTCKRLAADMIFDAARVFRTPGTVHTTTNRPVTYLIQADASGQGYAYTLPELASWFKVPVTDNALPEQAKALMSFGRPTKAKGTAPKRRRGRLKLNAMRAQDLIAIEQWRGGFRKRGVRYPQDCYAYHKAGRRFILTLYARFLRGAGESRATTLTAVRTMAANCRPPYPSDPDDVRLQDIVQGVFSDKKHFRLSNDRLCVWFGITPEVADELHLETIIPTGLKVARQRANHPKDKRNHRRAVLREYLEHYGYPTTGVRGLVRALSHEGIKTSTMTIHRDLKAIDFTL